MRLEFFVPGISRSSGSKSAFNHPTSGRAILAPAGKYQKKWQAKVSAYARQAWLHRPITGPLILTCVFYRKRANDDFKSRNGRLIPSLKPGRETKMPTGKPDTLKLCRAVEDSMIDIVYADDSLICEHHISKRYCDPGQPQGVKIIIETMDERKDVTHGKEEERAGTGSLFGSVGREGSDDGGHQPGDRGLPQG